MKSVAPGAPGCGVPSKRYEVVAYGVRGRALERGRLRGEGNYAGRILHPSGNAAGRAEDTGGSDGSSDGHDAGHDVSRFTRTGPRDAVHPRGIGQLSVLDVPG